MQIIKNKEKIGNILFTVAIIIELIIMMTDHMSSITLPLRGRFAQLAFLLFGCKILTTKYNIRQWILIIVMGLLGTVSYFTMGDEYILRAIVMVVAAKDIKRDDIYRIIFLGALAGTVIIIAAAATGLAGTLFEIKDYGRDGLEKRWCLGFNHANNVHCMFWYLTALFLYTAKKIRHAYTYIVLMIADILLYMLTASRTGFLATLLLIIGAGAGYYFKKLNQWKLPYILGSIAVLLCVGISVYGARYSCFESKLCAKLDRFLNNRLNMSHDYAYLPNWKMFPEGRELGAPVDNGIASFGYLYGIVMLSVMVLAILWLVWKAYKENSIILMAMVVTGTFVWFMESTFAINSSLLCTIFFILLFDRWYISESI